MQNDERTFDGLDVRNSFIFCRTHDMAPSMMQGKSDEEMATLMMSLFGGSCKKYTEIHPDFEGNTDLLNASSACEAQDYDNYAVSLAKAEPLLVDRINNRNEVDAMIILAGIQALRKDMDYANKLLRAALIDSLKGSPMNDTLGNCAWSPISMVTGFEKWLRDNDGVYIEGPSPFMGKDKNGNSTQSSSSNSGYSSTSSASAKSGCYVATAVYGSYDCPEVWTLRRYRDMVLAKTWYGRMFIHLYYSTSPTLVRLFGKETWFKRIIRPVLNKIVIKLNSLGYESSAYTDNV